MSAIKHCFFQLGMSLLLAGIATATPPGFVKSTIPLDGTPVGLAFDADGALFALEGASFGSNEVTLRAFSPSGAPVGSFPLAGNDPTNFFVGGMAYDPVGDQLLISDNTTDGRLYTLSKTGVQQTLATGIAGIAGIAVRNTGEIFVTTAPFASPGAVIQVDRSTGTKTEVLGGLALGAGLVFDGGDLIVQDVTLLPTFETRGRLQRLPITGTSVLEFGPAELLLDGMTSGYSVILDGEGDLYTTGSGGLYRVTGTPLAEVLLLPAGFSSAMAFDAGPFEKFAGPNGGRLAWAAEASWGIEDQFVTVLTPARPGDYNGDGAVDALDYAVWRGEFGTTGDLASDGNLDGIIDAADYVIWRHNAVLASGAAFDSTAGVPEPVTLALVLCPVAALIFTSRRVRG